MSGCEQVRPELGGYVVGGLTEDEIARVQAHLEECTGCRAELEELSALPGLLELAADESPQVPADLRERAVAHATASTRAARGSERHARRRTTALTAAAAALAGLVVGVGAVLAAVADPPADAVVALGAAEEAPAGLDGEAVLRDTDAGVRVDVRASGLPADGDVAYYHVWLEWPSGDWISAGTFRPSDDGEVAATLTCGGELADYAALTITAHPSEGEGEGDTVVRASLE